MHALGIQVDALDYLWVREYNLPGEEGDRASLERLRPGRPRSRASSRLPPELVIYEIGEDYILGKVLDELRVEYVQLWPLDRSS